MLPMRVCYCVLQVMYDANMYQLLPKISCPAMVVVGEKDFRWDERMEYSVAIAMTDAIW